MSGAIFPDYILGVKFTSRKSPRFNTGVQKALSGKTSRVGYQAYPLYDWELAFELLRDDADMTMTLFEQPGLAQQNSLLYGNYYGGANNGVSVGALPANYSAWSQDATQWGAPFVNGTMSQLYAVIPNYAIAPDGTYTADRILMCAGNANSGVQIFYVPGFNGQLPFTCVSSMWMKTNDGSTVSVVFKGVNGFDGNLVTVTPFWQRFSFVASTNPGVPNASGGTQPQVGLNGFSSSRYIDISVWGAQTEVGTIPGRYIRTYFSPVANSDLKTMFGLFNQMFGQQDTFLYQDPDFNTVNLSQFAVGTGQSGQIYNLTTTYQQGPQLAPFYGTYGQFGIPELVQNTNGPPQIYVNRGLGIQELLSTGLRQNLCLQSQFIGGASPWQQNGTNIAVTPQYTTSPDGTNDATRLQFSNIGANATSQLFQAIPGSGGNVLYTASFWARSNDGLTHNMMMRGSNPVDARPWIQAIQVTPSWQRFSFTFFTSGGGYVLIGLVTGNNGGSPINTDTGPADVLIWGAQFEPGAYATAYMSTSGQTGTNGGSDYQLTNLTTAGPVNTFQQVQFTNFVPINGASLLWSGSFYYRVKFASDSLDFGQFMNKWWELKKLGFEQVIL